MKDTRALAATRLWRDGRLAGENLDAAALRAARDEAGCLLWIDLVRPTADQLAEIGRVFDLRDTALEDALGIHERPKVTRHDDHLFFTTSATWLDAGSGAADGRGRLRSSRISGFVLPRALITVRLDDDLDMSEVTGRWDENAHLLGAGPRALVHGLLDVVVDGYFTTIQTLDDVIEGLEDELFEERSDHHDFTRRVYGLRKDLVALRRVVLPMREVVSGLLRHRDVAPSDRTPASGTELDSWFDDLYDHVLRAGEWTESLRDMVTSLFETNLSLQDSRLNQIMKQLAAWGAIIAVPTAITGWYGQNVPYPGFQEAFGLWQSVALVVALPVLLWFVFRRQGWL